MAAEWSSQIERTSTLSARNMLAKPPSATAVRRAPHRIPKRLTALERALIAEGGLLGVTPSTGDRVGSWHAGNARDRVGDELVVLDVEALDLGDRATDEL